MIYYKKTGNIPSGRLYDKYQNHTKRLRKLGILSSPSVTSPPSTPQSSADINEDDDLKDSDENTEVNIK